MRPRVASRGDADLTKGSRHANGGGTTSASAMDDVGTSAMRDLANSKPAGSRVVGQFENQAGSGPADVVCSCPRPMDCRGVEPRGAYAL